MMPNDVYRVTVGENLYYVQALDADPLEIDGSVYLHSALPMELKEKIAVLSMLKCPPAHYVEDVGRRINETTFWVFC